MHRSDASSSGYFSGMVESAKQCHSSSSNLFPMILPGTWCKVCCRRKPAKKRPGKKKFCEWERSNDLGATHTSERIRSWVQRDSGDVGVGICSGIAVGRCGRCCADATLPECCGGRSQRSLYPRLDFLIHEAVRDAVVMFSDLDMIIKAAPAALPLGILVRLIRQGGQPADRALRTARGDFVPAAVDRSARQEGRGSPH
ncbi:hypothetical protein ACVWY3_004912 [Bradyrhizobium sp. USDA 4486]